MLLSDRDIHTAIEGGRIQLDPLDLGLVQPASIDVRLDRVFRLFDNHRYAVIDPSVAQPELTRRVEANDDEPFVLHPGEFVLAHTVEVFNLPADISAEFKLNSSGARIGLDNALATWADPLWHGSTLTLELKNNTRNHIIRLHHGCRIGQMIFHRSEPVPEEKSYAVRGRYLNDKSVQIVK